MAIEFARPVRPLEGSAEILATAKRAYTTRRVPQAHMATVVASDAQPKIGDIIVAVVEKIGSHPRIELPSGRKAQLAVGDRIVLAYGNRYAPDQFEAIIEKSMGPCHMVAAGGVAATMVARHEQMSRPTQIRPLGFVADAAGVPINLSRYALQLDPRPRAIATVLVAGTSMNAGKTFTAAALVHSFARAGHKVAGIKATGTGAGGDVWLMSDMGASLALDFTDAGLPSTYLVEADRIERSVLGLVGHAADAGCDVAVVEIADGLQHEETASVLRSMSIRRITAGVVFAANDALGAKAGLDTLAAWGHPVLALSGQLTRSPLAIREAAKSTGICVVTASEIQAGALCSAVFAAASAVSRTRLDVAA